MIKEISSSFMLFLSKFILLKKMFLTDVLLQDEHPIPGQWYRGTQRTAYLPDTGEGRTVLMLLKVAFDRRLTFTVDRSATTGQVGIIWNDIHHKTDVSRGPEWFVYFVAYCNRT